MKSLRLIALGGALAIIAAAAAPALALVTGTVSGGGFYRTPNNGSGPGKSKMTKTQVAINGTDDTNGDYGQALVMEHTPGAKPTQKLNLQLDCVEVSGDTAFASGTDADGGRYYIVIEDNGEPGKGSDEFGRAGDNVARLAAFLLGIDCGAVNIATQKIHGGNFHVEEFD